MTEYPWWYPEVPLIYVISILWGSSTWFTSDRETSVSRYILDYLTWIFIFNSTNVLSFSNLRNISIVLWYFLFFLNFILQWWIKPFFNWCLLKNIFVYFLWRIPNCIDVPDWIIWKININNFFFQYFLLTNMSIKTRFRIISYMCVPRFCFHSESLISTPNTSNYMPKSPCSSPNGLVFSPKSLYGYVPANAAPSVRPSWGVGVLHAQITLRETRGRGRFKWVSLRRCAWKYFCARNLLRQSQSQTRLPVWLLGP